MNSEGKSRASGEAGADSFTTVRDVEDFKREILEQKTGAAAVAARPADQESARPVSTAPAPVAGAAAEITATLSELARLRDAGAITAAEYEAKKTELLARI